MILLFSISSSFAQFTVLVDVSSLDNRQLKEKVDENVSKLLSEINQAFAGNTVPKLTGIDISNDAISNVLALWETSHFRTQETEIYNDILNLRSGGMELREIRLYVEQASETEKSQEGVIEFSKTGTITNFYFALGSKIRDKVMVEGNDVTDLRRRETIFNFVENFRTAYNRKDLDLLQKVFSEDALIITGKVIKQKTSDGNSFMQNLPLEKIIYVKQTKSEYMTKMRQIFAANEYLNIKFDELKMVRHNKYPDYYGVTIKQHWNSSKYNDIGYVFLLIDFSDEDNLLIHVRTWQPEKVGERELAENEIFNIGTFPIKPGKK
jgi:RPA family protein